MLENKPWWPYLNSVQQNLIKQSFYLLDLAKEHKGNFYDYSFIVMPAAKAFEGFLKQLFLDLKLINKQEFEEDYFRVGKALNPELEHIKRLRKKCLYDEISEGCGKEIAQILWQTWKNCRNRLFHYFVKEQHAFTFKEADERLNQIVNTIGIAFRDCRVK